VNSRVNKVCSIRSEERKLVLLLTTKNMKLEMCLTLPIRSGLLAWVLPKRCDPQCVTQERHPSTQRVLLVVLKVRDVRSHITRSRLGWMTKTLQLL